jgi:hypothetical protein
MLRTIPATLVLCCACAGPLAPESRPVASRAPVTPAPAVVATAAAPADAPARPAAAPLAPRPTLLASGTTLHLLVVEGTAARCRPFQVEPYPERGEGWLRLTGREQRAATTVSVSYAYQRTPSGLTLREVAREVWTSEDVSDGMSTSCELALPLSEQDGALSVGGSLWFAGAEDCAAAREARLPVAAWFDDCELGFEPPSEADAARGLARFERLLRRGGSMYYMTSDDDGQLLCQQWRVRPHRRGQAEGEWSHTNRTGKVVETLSYGYHWNARSSQIGGGELPEVAVSGPSFSRRGPDGEEGWGMGCFNLTPVLGRDLHSVDLGSPTYLSRAACMREVAAERARHGWLPPPGEEQGERLAALGGVPGC